MKKYILHLRSNEYQYILYNGILDENEMKTVIVSNVDPLTIKSNTINESNPLWLSYNNNLYYKSCKIPNKDTLRYGEIAINYKTNKEKIFLKNDSDKIIAFEPKSVLHKSIKVNTSLFNNIKNGEIIKVETNLEEVLAKILSNGLVYTNLDANKVLSVNSDGTSLIFQKLEGGGGFEYKQGNGIEIKDHVVSNLGILDVKESTINGNVIITKNNIENEIKIHGLGTAAYKNDGIGSGLDADLLDGYDSSDFARSVHTHPISDVTDLQKTLDNKSDINHTHTIPDVTDLQTALDNKSDISHTHHVATATENGFLSNTDKSMLDKIIKFYKTYGNIYIHKKTMTINSTWQSIGIDNFTLLPTEGTYVVEFGPIGGNFGNSYYSAVFPWRNSNGNKSSYEDLKLNMCGTRGGGISSFSARVISSNNNISFQLSCYLTTLDNQKLTFKFRRIL